MWDSKNKAFGQCSVTALVIHDYFGGEIFSGEVEGQRYKHYWNILPNGLTVDLTLSQFNSKNINILSKKKKNIKDILKYKNVESRYLILKKRVEEFLNR